MRFISWLFVFAALFSLALAILLKIMNISVPFFASELFPFYPRSYMSFAEISLLFAIAFALLGKRRD